MVNVYLLIANCFRAASRRAGEAGPHRPSQNRSRYFPPPSPEASALIYPGQPQGKTIDYIGPYLIPIGYNIQELFIFIEFVYGLVTATTACG